MSTQIGNGNITFGDGTVQTTKTPTIVSAFVNDSGYLTNSFLHSNYAQSRWVTYRLTHADEGGQRTHTLWYDLNGALMGEYITDCNCNC